MEIVIEMGKPAIPDDHAEGSVVGAQTKRVHDHWPVATASNCKSSKTVPELAQLGIRTRRTLYCMCNLIYPQPIW